MDLKLIVNSLIALLKTFSAEIGISDLPKCRRNKRLACAPAITGGRGTKVQFFQKFPLVLEDRFLKSLNRKDKSKLFTNIPKRTWILYGWGY